MIRLTFKLAMGILLTGCTVNNYHSGSLNTDYIFANSETTIVDTVLPKEEIKSNNTPHTLNTVQGNKHIRAECEVYVPLKVPEPIKIDFKELEKATTSQAINGVILNNIKDIRSQMMSFSIRQEKHYAEYVKRCVVK